MVPTRKPTKKGTGTGTAGIGARGSPEAPGQSRRAPRAPRALRAPRAFRTLREAAFQSGSPGRLRRIGAVAAAGALLAGVGGGLALSALTDGLDQAHDATAHLVRTQEVRTSLAQEEVAVTKEFLQERPGAANRSKTSTDHLVEYAAARARATEGLARAARTGTGDGDDYAAISRSLARYAEYVEFARVSNRQGLPAGATYLLMSSELLHSDVIPALDEVARADTARATDGRRQVLAATAVFAGCAVTGILALILAQVSLARIMRRVFTVPAAATGAVLLVTVVVVGAATATASSTALSQLGEEFVRAEALTRVRSTAFDARSRESLPLVDPDAPDGQQHWQEAMDTTRTLAVETDPDVVAPLDAYARAHAALHDQILAGNRTGAVDQVLAISSGSPTYTFRWFDYATQRQVDLDADSLDDSLREAARLTAPGPWALVMTGILAAMGAILGVTQRLEQYR